MVDTESVIQALPTPAFLNVWADELIPGDVWYWDASPLDLDLTGCQVMTPEAYRADATYNTIAYDNAYLSWKMPPEVVQLIISEPKWIGDLSGNDRQSVLKKQVALNRGLVFPAEWFGDLPAALQPYVVEDQVVLGQAVWASLPADVQHRALRAEQRRWEEVDCYPVPEDAQAHVRAVANRFISHEGTNCFAITVYGATANPELLTTWLTVSPVDLMAPLGYREVPDLTPIADDIVIFERDGRVIHAVWCAGRDRFLNKNGQSRISPIRIVDWEMLRAEWPDVTRTTIYRRGEASNEE